MRTKTVIAVVCRLWTLPFIAFFYMTMTCLVSLPALPTGIIIMIGNLVTLDQRRKSKYTLIDGSKCFALPFIIIPVGVFTWMKEGELLNNSFYAPLTDIIDLYS